MPVVGKLDSFQPKSLFVAETVRSYYESLISKSSVADRSMRVLVTVSDLEYSAASTVELHSI